MTTFLVENPIFLEHTTPEGHPERSDRIRALNLALEHERFSPLVREKAPQANEDFVLLAIVLIVNAVRNELFKVRNNITPAVIKIDM